MGRALGGGAADGHGAVRDARDDVAQARQVLRLVDARVFARLHARRDRVDRFISFKKNVDFIGRAAVEAERNAPPDRILAAFEVDADDADVVAYEPIWIGGQVKGFCTSGGYSHHASKSVALGFVPRYQAVAGLEVEIEILGDMRPARLVTEPLFDADGTRMRG